MHVKLFTLFFSCLITLGISAQTLDTNFGTNGTFTSNFGFTDIYIQTGLSSHNDLTRGAIVGIHNGDISLGSFQILSDGTLDTSVFPPDGINLVKPSDLGVSADDGFISNIVTSNAGESFGAGNVNLTTTFLNGQFGMVSKTLPTGATDTNFGNFDDGISVIGGEQNESLILKHIALASDNSQLLTINYTISDYSILVKYNPMGSLNSSFGEVVIDFPSTFTIRTTTEHLTALSDDSAVVAGHANTINGHEAFLYKVDDAGTPATTFGTNGFAGSELSGGNNMYAWAVFEQTDGALLTLITEEISASDYQVKLAKFDTNGNLDTSFGGGDGVADLGVSLSTNLNLGQSYAIAEDNNGNILFAYNNLLYKTDISTESLDSNFGSNGIYTATDNISAIHVKDDGKITFSGTNTAGSYYVTQLIFNSLSLDEIVAEENAFTLYPVPSNSELFIDGEATDYKIYSLSGKLIMKGKYNNGIDINLIPKGVYIIEMKSNSGKTVRQKFMKD